MHEIKHDGFRLQIHARGKRVSLYTMTGVDWTARYPWIVEDVGRLNVRHAILDAECVCDRDKGIADFERLMTRVHDASAYAYAFDLLALDSDDTRRLPLSERKAALGKLLRKAKPGIRYSEHLSGDGRIVFDQACKLGLEGIVSKRLNSGADAGAGGTRRGSPALTRRTSPSKPVALVGDGESFGFRYWSNRPFFGGIFRPSGRRAGNRPSSV